MQTDENEKRRSETICFPVSNEGPSGPWAQKSLISALFSYCFWSAILDFRKPWF